MFCLLDNMRFHISFCEWSILVFFSLKNMFLLILSFVFFLVVFLVADFVSAASGRGVM